MASSILTITLEIEQPPGLLEREVLRDASRGQEALVRLAALLEAVASKSPKSTVTVGLDTTSDLTHASATVTCTSVIATDTITIGSVTLTVVASAANEDQVTVGGDDEAMADNLAAAINAHSKLKGIVSATADGVDTVTITAVTPGRWGNLIALSTADATFTLSAANLENGVSTQQAATRTHNCGLGS